MEILQNINPDYYIGKKLSVAQAIARMNGEEIKEHDSAGWLLPFDWLTTGWNKNRVIFVTVNDDKIIKTIVRVS